MLKRLILLFLPCILFAQSPMEKEKLPLITYPAGPLPNHAIDFVIDAEFLYWYATATNLAYATKNIITSQGSTANPDSRFVSPEKIYEPSWSWDPGVRFGLDVITNHDGWDVYAEWTWYYNNTLDSIKVPRYPSLVLISHTNPIGTEALTSPWMIDGTSESYSSVHTRWSQQLNQWNLELGRKFFISPKLVLRPFGGLRGHTSRMYFRVRGDFHQQGLPQGFGMAESKARFTQNFWGIGLLGGLETQWNITRNWAIFIDGAISLLYGPFKITSYYQVYQTSSQGATIRDINQKSTHSDVYTLQPVYDLALGVRWSLPIYDSAYRICFDIGWENHLYPGYNHLDPNVSATQNGATYLPADGDLTLSGLILRGQFEF